MNSINNKLYNNIIWNLNILANLLFININIKPIINIRNNYNLIFPIGLSMSSGSFTPFIKVEHVISFSDAVFAFAITLMALSIVYQIYQLIWHNVNY